MILGVFGAILAFAAAVLLPFWVAAGVYITIASPAYESVAILVESLLLWAFLLYWRILASRGMGIPSWYALTTPLGAAVFGAMMLTSAFKVISGKGVVWKGRRYKR